MVCCAASPCGAQGPPACGKRKSAGKMDDASASAEQPARSRRTGPWSAGGQGAALRSGGRAASRTPGAAGKRRLSSSTRRRNCCAATIPPQAGPKSARAEGSLQRHPRFGSPSAAIAAEGVRARGTPFGRRRPPPARFTQKAVVAHVQRSGWSSSPAGRPRAVAAWPASSARPTARAARLPLAKRAMDIAIAGAALLLACALLPRGRAAGARRWRAGLLRPSARRPRRRASSAA